MTSRSCVSVFLSGLRAPSESRANAGRAGRDFKYTEWPGTCFRHTHEFESPPRFVPAGSLVEITARTIGGRYFLVPSEELDAGIWSILGRALSKYPIELHAVAFMSNHWHALASVADAQALSRFVQYVHANVARLVRRLRGWTAGCFQGRYIIAALHPKRLAAVVLSQGGKEGGSAWR